jgi:hypothetical protein
MHDYMLIEMYRHRVLPTVIIKKAVAEVQKCDTILSVRKSDAKIGKVFLKK